MFQRIALIALGLFLVTQVPMAQAQARRGSSPGASSILDHKAELHVFGGYSWTWSRRVGAPTGIGGSIQYGDADISDSGFWGIELDYNVAPGQMVEFMYSRQDAVLTFNPDTAPKKNVSDIAVHYYQIGGLAGVPQGNIFPYGSFTLGLTYFSPKNNFDDQPFVDSTTRFSVIPGLGVRIYAGERIVLRLQARLPISFFGGGVGFGCGGGGCGTTVGGYGLTQFDLGGGLGVRF